MRQKQKQDPGFHIFKLSANYHIMKQRQVSTLDPGPTVTLLLGERLLSQIYA